MLRQHAAAGRSQLVGRQRARLFRLGGQVCRRRVANSGIVFGRAGYGRRFRDLMIRIQVNDYTA